MYSCSTHAVIFSGLITYCMLSKQLNNNNNNKTYFPAACRVSRYRIYREHCSILLNVIEYHKQLRKYNEYKTKFRFVLNWSGLNYRLYNCDIWAGMMCYCVVCDVYCTSGCVTQGGGKCDSSCATGHTLNTTVFICSPGMSVWETDIIPPDIIPPDIIPPP